MRVLTVSNLYPPDVIGGYEIACKQAVEALRGRGHEVRVLTASPRRPVPSEEQVDRHLRLTDFFSDFVNRQSTHSAIRLMDAEAFRINSFNVHQLFDAIDRFQPDVVYLCSLLGLGGLGLLAGLHHLRVPWVWQLGDDVPVVLCRPFGDGPNRLMEEVARQVRGSYIAVSQKLAFAIEEAGFPLRPSLRILPNWIVGEKVPLKAPYRPGEPLRIVSAGRIVPEKGIDVLIESARLLREGGIDRFTIDLYGKIQDLSFPSKVLKEGLETHVRFLGPLPHAELMRRYVDYDVFAFPTWEQEPFGLVPLEAASRGCVPIISRLCGVAEWLVDGVHCLKAERTGVAFAERFRQIYLGGIDLAGLARRGHAAVYRDFHIDTVIPEIEQTLLDASRMSRAGAGRPEEFHRIAIIAERLVRIMAQESCAA